jgi:hypothetical protein
MSFDSPSTPYSDPTAAYLNSACLDFLLIELVPMAYRIAADLAAREEEWTRGGAAAGDTGSLTGKGESAVDEEETREAVFFRLEMLGYRVGLGVVERWV